MLTDYVINCAFSIFSTDFVLAMYFGLYILFGPCLNASIWICFACFIVCQAKKNIRLL